MERAKITLSPTEMELVQNAGFFLTKQAIINKVYGIFGNLAGRWQQSYPNTPSLSPKISRGENFEQLPWVMLDLIRRFERERALAIRVFFWWGNYFSCTLHMKNPAGSPPIFQRDVPVQDTMHPLYVSTKGDEWNHNVYSDDYVEIGNNEALNRLLCDQQHAHVKLSTIVNFSDWDGAEEKLYGAIRSWMLIANATASYAPMR